MSKENKTLSINPKIFFFDNDSTLFDHSGKGEYVFDSVYEALEKLKAKGYLLCMNTSRGLDEMYNVPKRLLDLFDDISLLSGAYLMHDGKVDITCMDPNDVKTIIKDCDALGITYRYATKDGGGYLNQSDADKEGFFYRLYEMTPPIKKYEGEDVLHFIVYTDEETSNKIVAKTNDVECAILSVASEYGPKGINKGTALLRVCKRHNIDPKDACAFGDSGNDISMFEKAGLGICMGNGSDSAKQSADYITDTAYEDGIYNALKHFKFID